MTEQLAREFKEVDERAVSGLDQRRKVALGTIALSFCA
jgi:hypothetical protein